jgi:hypothetical protein
MKSGANTLSLPAAGAPTLSEEEIMTMFVPMFAAAGYSLLYLLLGGGLGGAVLIYFVAKGLGK